MTTPSAQPHRFSRRYRFHGLVASVVVHLGGVVAMILWTYQPWWYDAWLAHEARTIEVSYAAEAESDEEEADTGEVRIVSDPAEVTQQMVAERIEEEAEAAEDLSSEEKLARLNELSERLSDVSSPESVDAMADVFQGWFGTAPRATEPADEPAEGDFDFATAQFHDVIRTPIEPDGYRYTAILLDAAGRTWEVEMSAAEGQTLFDTMQQIKQNPLLEAVYRQIVMPLLDQMIDGARQAEDALETTRQMETEVPDDAPSGP